MKVVGTAQVMQGTVHDNQSPQYAGGVARTAQSFFPKGGALCLAPTGFRNLPWFPRFQKLPKVHPDELFELPFEFPFKGCLPSYLLQLPFKVTFLQLPFKVIL